MPCVMKTQSRKKATTYEVTLRRDVQQAARVCVEALSRQEAIDVAESIVDNVAWSIEEHIGTHKPEVRREVKS